MLPVFLHIGYGCWNELFPTVCKELEWTHARLLHEFDKLKWNEWGEVVLVELKVAHAEIQSSGDKRERMNISWLARVAGINREDIYGRLRYLPEMQAFF